MLALAGSLLVLGTVVAAQGDPPPTVCVALARSEVSGVDLSAPLRDAVVVSLRGANLNVIALNSGMDGAVAEGSQKNCSHLVLTRVQTHSGGGLMRGMTNLRKMTAAMPRLSQDAAPSGPAVPLATAEAAAIKRGDTVGVDYQLTPGRSLTPIKSGKLESKAGADGEDVLGPLVTQLSGTVATAARSGDANAAAAPPPPAPESGSRRGGRSRDTAASTPKDMNCEQIAAQSRGSVTVAACRQMLGAQQSFDKAANDPSAWRPGDDGMSCDQIAAEMKQQQFTPVDQAKVAEAQAATTDFRDKAAEEQKKGEALAAKESAEMSLASRLAVTNAAAAAASEKIAAEQKANNERVEREMAPKAERMMTSNAAVISDVTNNMTANPRVARLAQLAMKKGCKVQ